MKEIQLKEDSHKVPERYLQEKKEQQTYRMAGNTLLEEVRLPRDIHWCIKSEERIKENTADGVWWAKPEFKAKIDTYVVCWSNASLGIAQNINRLVRQEGKATAK